MPEFAIVNAHVLVNEFFGKLSCSNDLVYEIENHIRVVNICLCVFCKAIIVVPLAHKGKAFVSIQRKQPFFPVMIKQSFYFPGRKSKRFIELRFQTYVPSNVKPACDIVHGHW